MKTRSNGCEEDDAHTLSRTSKEKSVSRLHARMDCIMCVYLSTYVDCAAKLIRHTKHTKRTRDWLHAPDVLGVPCVSSVLCVPGVLSVPGVPRILDPKNKHI